MKTAVSRSSASEAARAEARAEATLAAGGGGRRPPAEAHAGTLTGGDVTGMAPRPGLRRLLDGLREALPLSKSAPGHEEPARGALPRCYLTLALVKRQLTSLTCTPTRVFRR